MAETDILNANIHWDRSLEDAPGPDFGWSRLRASQLATAKAAGGGPFYRTIGNGGHSTQFSWLNRSQKLSDFLKQWAEQHEDGFFTIIDHDGGGRHYVGTFSGDTPVSEAGNDRYNMQGWTFVETPGAPMLEYPGNWDSWAVMELPWSDFGTLRTAFSGNWTRPAAVSGDDGFTRTPNALQNLAPAVGDSLTHEYRGYGFRLWANQGNTYGKANVLVDGVLQGTVNLVSDTEIGSQVVFEWPNVSLGIHRVQMVITAAPGMVYNGIEVMR